MNDVCSDGSSSSGSDLPGLASFVRQVAARVPQILLVYLFGSQARGDAGPESDVDIAILLARRAQLGQLRDELAHALSLSGGEISFDLVLLNEAPIELAYSVISQGKVLYERTLAERVEYEADVMSRYGDYLPFLRAQRKDILEGTGNDRRIQRYREALGRTFRTLGAPGTFEGTAHR